MFFERFYDTDLAQASYMLGCQKTGECLVIDPVRDVQKYLDKAAEQKLRITHVTETHIHADYLSGSRELAQDSVFLDGAQRSATFTLDAPEPGAYRAALSFGGVVLRQLELTEVQP